MQSWPPTQDYRLPQRVPTLVTVLLLLLALLLVGSGLGFIVYSTSTQYKHSLRSLATAQVQSTKYVLATSQARLQGTIQAARTAQSYIDATTTAQTNNVATATATFDAATATVSAFGDLYTQATNGTPTVDDSLSDNTGKSKWEGTSTATLTGCAFLDDGYHVTEAQQGKFQPCFAQATNFDNLAYQVSITINKGYRAQAGILIRADTSANIYYFFHIGTDGSYAFDLYGTDNKASTLTSGTSTAITTGLGQSNQVAIIAKGTTFYLFVNSQYIDFVSDKALSKGKIGVGVINVSTPVDATVSNAQVWKVSPTP